MRARSMRNSASSRLRNGGYTRTTPGSDRLRCFDARPSGPPTRTATSVGVKRPRRVGRSVVCTLAVPLAGNFTLNRRAPAPQRRCELVGDAASHRSIGRVHQPPPHRRGRAERHDGGHGSLDRDRFRPHGQGEVGEGDEQEDAVEQEQPTGQVRGQQQSKGGDADGDRGQTTGGDGDHAALIGAPAPRRGCRRSRRRRSRPRARPRVVAARGGAAPASRPPSPRRA